MAKLKLKIVKLEEVDEALRSLYVQQADGSFLLDAEPDPDAARIGEFRTNNIELKKQLDAWVALGMTPEQAKAKLAEVQKKAADDEHAKLNAQQLTDKYEKQLAEIKAAADKAAKELQAKLDRHEIHGPIRKALVDKGAIAGEVDDLIESLERRGQFRRGDDGKLQFLDAQGDPILGMTLDKFADQVRKDRARWFEPVKPGGAGTRTSDRPAGPGDVKTISAEDQGAINASLEEIAAGKAVVAAE